jgi:hypothetical protein
MLDVVSVAGWALRMVRYEWQLSGIEFDTMKLCFVPKRDIRSCQNYYAYADRQNIWDCNESITYRRFAGFFLA